MSEDLIRGHASFQKKFLTGERQFLQRLASDGQSPSALYVGCSDSRVVPELLTSSSPGDLFVVRNIANLVPPLEHADASVGAALEYAVGHLHVPHLIVCGHDGCGGVKAALDDDPHIRDLPSLQEWLSGVKPAIAHARSAGLEGKALWRRAVEENVIHQLENLLTFEPVRKALEAETLELHGWVYDLFTLDLRVYDVNSDQFLPADSIR